ncbi:MAG: COG1361 S-layer family protein [Methanotrichaceae archaeon]
MKERVILSIILIAFVLLIGADAQEDHGQIIVSSVSGVLEIGRPATIAIELKNNASGEQSLSIFGDKETCLEVMAELHSSDDRIHVLSSPQTAGSLAPGESRSVEFVASTDQGMDTGIYPMDLILSYSKLSGIKASGDIPDILFNYENIKEALPLELKVRLGPKLSLEVGDVATPGVEADLAIRFMNHGDESISDLQIQLLPQDPFMPAPEKINLGNIDPGSSASARFRILTANQTASGYYALPSNISYKRGQSVRSDELSAIVKVEERSWSNIIAMPIVIAFLIVAAYLVIKTRTGRKRLRRRL